MMFPTPMYEAERITPTVKKVLEAVGRAHWRAVRAALRSGTVRSRITMKKPTTAEVVEAREDVTSYLLENGASELGMEFSEGIRQTLGWVLGVSARPDYRNNKGPGQNGNR